MDAIPESLAGLVVPVGSLRTYGRNPRSGDVDAIAESLRVHGQYRPVVVNRRTGEVLAGNHTLKAAVQLGWSEVAATFVDVDEDEAARIVLVDNRSNDLAVYDDRALADLLEGLPDLAGTGFDQGALDELLAKVTEFPPSLTDPDDVPDVPADPRSEVGDVWLLGPHRLVCGDSTDVGVFDALMMVEDRERTVVGFTSPPYNAGSAAESLTGNSHMTGGKYGAGHVDELSGDEWRDLCVASQENVLGHARFACVNMQMIAGNKRSFVDLLGMWRDRLADVAIWNKANAQPAMARNVMNSKFEWLIFLGEEGASRSISTGDFRGTVDNVYDGTAASNREFAELHAATFPVHLPSWFVKNFTSRKAVVIDSFGGTGTTLIACHQADRVARLIELDPRYVDVICRRYQEATGVKPVLESTGAPVDFTDGD